MKDLIHYLIALLAFAAVLSACSRYGGNAVPTGWESQDEALDSLTREIELAFMSSASADSIAALIDTYGKLTSLKNDDGETAARMHFWNGRIAGRMGQSAERQRNFNEALRTAPSGTADYIRRRIGWLEEDMSGFSRKDWYTHLVEEAEYYKERSDAIMLYARYVELMELMRDIGFNSKAARYLALADSCGSIIYGGEFFPGQELNRAVVLYEIGDVEGAGQIYRRLHDNPEAMADKDIFELVNYNMFLIYKDTVALEKAWRSVEGTSDDMRLIPKIAAEMAACAMARGNLPEATRFAEAAARKADMIGQSEQRLRVLKVVAEVSDSTGDSALSLAAWRKYALAADSVASLLLENEVADLEVKSFILDSERIAAEKKFRRNMIGFACIVMSGIVIAVVVFFSLRRIRRLKRERKTALEQKRQSEQQQIALQLGVERKDRVMDEAISRLHEFKDERKIDSGTVESLEQILSGKSPAGLGTDDFQKLFSHQNPEFVDRIRSLAPNISDSALRLAGYMAIGLSTKEISDLMNVRPDSVKQGRWRLRKALGLSPDTDLKAFLSSLLKDSRKI